MFYLIFVDYLVLNFPNFFFSTLNPYLKWF